MNPFSGALRRLIQAGALLVSCLPWFANAQNTVQWRTNYYTVTGATLPEIHRSMSQARPWKNESDMHGYTDWRIDWRVSLVSSAGTCQCSAFDTFITITNTLPQWLAPTNAPSTVRQIWERYRAALGEHEAGHARIAFAAEVELRRRIERVGEDADCEQLRAKINRVAGQVLDEFRQQEKDYDQRTRHGATQGAVLPGNIKGAERRRR